tara:strand:+ start:886 stop:1593 length:708 start_codon:yes stop_codon:yes gene_type:complete
MTDTAIILAGGLGTRLRNTINNVPKPMAPIDGKPFLYYLLKYLEKNKIRHVLLSVGYKKEIISEYFGNRFKSIEIKYSEESSPLGTGGAIARGLNKLSSKRTFIINGDTYFNISLKSLENMHNKKNSSVTIAVKKITEPDRYDCVSFNSGSKIIGFNNKNSLTKYINGGISIVDIDKFNQFRLPRKFSFESDFLFKYYKKENFYTYKSKAYFIDIGIPESYSQFNITMQRKNSNK